MTDLSFALGRYGAEWIICIDRSGMGTIIIAWYDGAVALILNSVLPVVSYLNLKCNS